MGVSKENMQNSGSLSKDKDKKREQVIKKVVKGRVRDTSFNMFSFYAFLLAESTILRIFAASYEQHLWESSLE